MDGNKDEAMRCVCIAEDAISAGNKERALKFIRLAQRLNHSVQVDELLAACENLNSGCGSSKSGFDEKPGEKKSKDGGPIKSGKDLNGEPSYTQEHVEIIKQITCNKDYYSVLGLERTCSVEEIKKAYRKFSLKVHPDKNKAPGSEEAFKKVCRAFKCLSDDSSRRQYDRAGLVEEYENDQQYNVRRRRRTEHDLFEDNFDPNEIFRAFFGQGDVYRTSHVYRTGRMHSQTRADFQGGRPNFFILLQILPFLLIFLLAYLPFSEPEYSLHKNDSYTILLTTEKHGVEYYVKSSAFDEKYPPGSGVRADMENMVIKDHRNMLWRYCHIELQRRQWNRNLPTPHCDKLQALEVEVA